MAKKLSFTETLQEKAYICEVVKRLAYTLDDSERDVLCTWDKTGKQEEHVNRSTGEVEMRDIWDYVPKTTLSEEDEIKLLAIERIRTNLASLI